MPENYRLFVNPERTVLVRIWPAGQVEVATREASDHIWGPPVVVEDEDAASPRTLGRDTDG